MSPIGTEVMWHSNKSGMVTRACCSVDETINTTNKRINDYSICTLCTVHATYSQSSKLSNSGQNSEESSAVACSHAFHFPGDHNQFLASQPHQLGCQYATFCFCTLLYSTLSCNKAVFIHRTLYSTVSIDLSWHSSECKG